MYKHYCNDEICGKCKHIECNEDTFPCVDCLEGDRFEAASLPEAEPPEEAGAYSLLGDGPGAGRNIIVKYFKVQIRTNRFNKNQIVWVHKEFANHLSIRYKYRGKGRYVSGILDKWSQDSSGGFNKIIGDGGLKQMTVDFAFAKRHELEVIE